MTSGTILPERIAPGRFEFAARADRLAAMHRYLATRPTPVMDLLTRISVRRAAEYELDAAIRTLAGALDEVERHQPAPVSRLAAFMPSNVILYSYVLYLVVPSLFVDRLCFRPASQVRTETLALHELLAPVHELPIEARVVSQRAFMREDITASNVVVFTGTYQNAEAIRPQLRPEQLFLYLGAGINPFVVAPGADLQLAARDAVDIRLLNSGQDCLAPDLFLVPTADLDTFLDLLIGELKGRRYGDYADPDAHYGPIFYAGALEAAALYLCKNQERIVHGGAIDFRNRRLEPAVVVSPLERRPAVEEFFAPVFNVMHYDDMATVTGMLAGGVFAERALGASVYGPAPELIRVLRQRHTVTVDSTLATIDNGNEPFGGYGPMANYAAHRGALHVAPILISAAAATHLGRVRKEDSLDG